MFSTTDYIVMFALLFFAYRGAKKGLIKTLLGPISLIIASIAAFIYYNQTKDLKITLLISILGPIAISLIGHIIIALFRKILNKKKKISISSQLIGALISIVCSGTILILSIVLITLIPFDWSVTNAAKNDILSSRTYDILNSITKNKLTDSTRALHRLSNAAADPKKLKRMQNSPEYKRLRKNENFRELLRDEKTVKQLQDKDFVALLKNPRIQELLQDKEFIKSLLQLNKQLLR